ncbi:MAG: CoA pyrophosphatase [Firmicutes bacterium HGW-Firmicutes-11]|jgi:8-oxo-dGTP pyrophosphatase MutT (NUDIX family)|nr:MAG: CoA pyrophosphatase [Firmicutes bacterium HGW-Firmicutes-11]
MNLHDFERVFRDRTPRPQGRHRYYSVMVPLVQKGDDLFLLFEVRAEDMEIQPGEVCFPGGRQEDGESAEDCAVRETCEELGISRDDIRIIAPLDYILMYSHFTLHPFLAVIDEAAVVAAQPNPSEVKEIFLVPLSFFQETEPTTFDLEVAPLVPEDFPYEMINAKGGYNWRKGRNSVPIYQYEGHAIWGLTARIACHLVHVMKQET